MPWYQPNGNFIIRFLWWLWHVQSFGDLFVTYVTDTPLHCTDYDITITWHWQVQSPNTITTAILYITIVRLQVQVRIAITMTLHYNHNCNCKHDCHYVTSQLQVRLQLQTKIAIPLHYVTSEVQSQWQIHLETKITITSYYVKCQQQLRLYLKSQFTLTITMTLTRPLQLQYSIVESHLQLQLRYITIQHISIAFTIYPYDTLQYMIITIAITIHTSNIAITTQLH